MGTAFVLAGGGSLGSIQVGMLRALSERGVVPDLLVGTSAGALNAAYLAGHGTGQVALDDLAAQWIGTRRADVFPLNPVHQLAAILGSRAALFSNRRLQRLVQTHVSFDRIEESPVTLRIVATDLLTGTEVVLSHGSVVDAVLASSAIPSMLPAVMINSRLLVDGGLADNAAISAAVEMGADRIVVLPTGYACALTTPPTRPLAVAMHAIGILTHQRLVRDIEFYQPMVALYVVPPPCPVAVSPADFSQAALLIDAAYSTATRWINWGGLETVSSAGPIALHRHR